MFDYLGEPGPSNSSEVFRVGSSFGSFDYAGFAKSAAFWYRALWLAAVPLDDPGRPPLPAEHVVRISQTWNTPPPPSASSSSSAITMDIQVFSDLPLVELYLDGRSLGDAPCGPGSFAAFSAVPYTFGNLTAVGRAQRGGAVLASHTQVASSTMPSSIELSLDAPSVATGTGTALLLDGHDVALVRATVRDAAGMIVPNATNVISFAVQRGPGRIAGVHNGDAASHEPQFTASRAAYHGLARAVVRVTADAASASVDELSLLASHIELPTMSSNSGDGGGAGRAGAGAGAVMLGRRAAQAGPIVVTATSPGLASGTVQIPVSTDEKTHGVLAVAAEAAHSKRKLRFD